MEKDKRTEPHKSPKNLYLYSGLMLVTFVLLASGLYLFLVSLLEKLTEQSIENISFQYIFASHIFAGLMFIIVSAFFALTHFKKVYKINNSQAKKHGIRLLALVLLIALSGLLLIRGVGWFEILNATYRSMIYWLHILLSSIIIIQYCIHRTHGRNKLSIKNSFKYLAIGSTASIIFFVFLTLNHISNSEIKVNFSPSLIKTETGPLIESSELMRDGYCKGCHADTHNDWTSSAHRFSSFNNPFYRFALNNTREMLIKRDGNVEASRFCAGCHDPVPLLSGMFDDNEFDLNSHPSASAGLTCSVCHSITSIDSPRGNADFTINKPKHYPFAFSDNEILRMVNHFLIKSNPSFHKTSFLKPLHKSTEFCGSCHKVHIPEALNDYRWLRGQNHYDSFLLSGVSGHNIDSFYYPEVAENNCNGCHMKQKESNDFGAKSDNLMSQPTIHDHSFASGNTALPFIKIENSQKIIEKHREFLEDSLSIDIIGLRKGADISGEFIFLDESPATIIQPGESYLVEVVLRTLSLGHEFTNGTADSNQIWLELLIYDDQTLIAGSGMLDADKRLDDANTHTITNYLVDKNGNQIKNRNVEDIYTSAFNTQIPPGAADLVHYKFSVPEDIKGTLSIKAKLHYRKFTTNYLLNSLEDNNHEQNVLPIITIAQDSYAFSDKKSFSSNKPEKWKRLNDYGISLFRKQDKSQFRQAEEIFKLVENEGNHQGTLNLVRLYYKEGRLDEASKTLNKLNYSSINNPWSAEWYSALINIDNGYYEEGIQSLNKLISQTWSIEALSRNFDFSKDYRLLNKLASTLLFFSRTKSSADNKRNELTQEAKKVYNTVLTLDPENSQAHFGLSQIFRFQNNLEQATHHLKLHERYKSDENARSNAVTEARARNAVVDKKANNVVIYTLN